MKKSLRALLLLGSALFVCGAMGVAQQVGAPAANRERVDRDNPRLRQRWERERFGDPSTYAARLVREQERLRAMYPAQVPLGRVGEPQRNLIPFAGPTWQSLGPTNASFETNGVTLSVVDSGRLRNILPDPANANTVYVLSAGGGLWKTTTFGSSPPTWIPLTDSLLTTGGGAVSFGASTSVFYLGLGDPFDTSPLAGGAITKSIDGGNTWTTPIKLNNSFISSSVRDVKVDAGAGTSGADVVLAATDVGMFRSVDGGTTYSSVLASTTFNGLGFWSIVKTSAGWLAAAENFNTLAGSLFISADHGATWNAITNTGSVLSGEGRVTLGVGVPGDSVVYAFAADTGDNVQLDLFRSTDGGQNWTALGLGGKTPTNPNSDQPDMNLMHGQAFYNHMLLVDPTDTNRNTVYIGGDLSSAKSTDGGATWKIITNWLPNNSFSNTGSVPYAHADFHCAAFSNIGGTKTVFFGSDGGIFVSTDGGTTWNNKKNIGLVDTLHYSLTSNPSDSNTTITGLQDNGTRVRETNTSVFDQTIGGDGFGTGTGQASTVGTFTLGSVYFDDIESSDDLGVDPAHWIDAFNGINTGDAGFFTEITAPEASADSTGKVFFTTGTHDIYKTIDGGANWTSIGSSGLNGINASRVIRNTVHAVGVSPIDTNHVAAAGNAGIVPITTNGGASWTESSIPASLGSSWGLNNANVVWANNSILYVASEANSAGTVKVVRSGDGGATWQAANSGLPDVQVSRLLVDPRDSSGNTVYAGTFVGVFKTTNGGTSWILFGAGLPQVHVTDMYMPSDGSFLRIATFGRGIWQISTTGTVDHLQVVAPATAQAGVPFSITVKSVDVANAVEPSYRGTVHFTSSDGSATLPANYTFTAGDNGVHTFNGVALASLGAQTITATDTVTATITGSASIGVSPGPATSLSVAAPGTATAGTAFSVTVTARDQFNHTATGYSGTVHFTGGGVGATLPANYTFTVGDAGVHVFTNGFTLDQAGAQTITASDFNTGTITGNAPVTVNAGALNKFAVVKVPAGGTVSVNTAFTLQVTAQDQFNNTVTSYTGTVQFASSDVGAGVVLPANYTYVGGDAGVRLFSVTLATAGTQSVTVNDTVSTGVTGSASISVVSSPPINPDPGKTIRMFRPVTPVVVASFTTTDSLGNLSAMIAWGDGATSLGTIVSVGANAFNVTASHAYAKHGKFTVTVTINSVGGSQAVVNSNASFFPRTIVF